jgi:hypothetical protein
MVDVAKIGIPSLVTALAAVLAVWLTGRNQARHLTLQLSTQVAEKRAEWFLKTYATDAIDPLVTAIMWLNDIASFGRDETISEELRECAYLCLARISTLVNGYEFYQFFNFLLAAHSVIAVSRRYPAVWRSIGSSDNLRLNRGYSEAHRVLNQLQQAVHAADVRLPVNSRGRVYIQRSLRPGR